VAIVIIAREVFVTILRHIAESRGVSFAATVTGKVKMFVQSVGIGTVMVKWAFVSRPWGDWFTVIMFALMLIVTIVSGIKSLQRPRK
jgi:phosphatidylglycerophosphate synthase